MKRITRILTAAALTVCLGAALMQPIGALTPSYTPSAAYRKSTYYQNLKNIPVTGDNAFDTVALAVSQVRYHEGNKQADFGGGGTGGGNFTEYNYANGTVSGSYGYAWCASFASWCLTQTGSISGAGGTFVSCTLWVDKLRELGQYRTRSSGYVPKTGDLIFFRSAGVSRASDHVGLVRYVRGGRVYTVEGNSSNSVTLRDYALTDSYIVGYGQPRYGGTRHGFDIAALDGRASGWYTVTNGFVNLRSARSASSNKLGTLSGGQMVRVRDIGNGWGRVDYGQGTAYISLDYVVLTAPVTYTVRYDDGEGEGAPAAASYFSFTSAKVEEGEPRLSGHRFLHWKTEDGKIYRQGDTLPEGDVRLLAVFERIVPTEPNGESGGENVDDTEENGTVVEEVTDSYDRAEQGTVEQETAVAEQAPEDPVATLAAGIATGVLSFLAMLWWSWRRLSEWAK